MPQYLSILVTVALFAGIDAQINDPLECTEIGTQGPSAGELVYSPTATICSDPLGDAGCKVLYGGGNGSEIAPGNDAPRPSPCFSTQPNGTTIDPSMKAGAIKNCPKDPAWRQPIANSCPNRCGMCQMGGCVDKAVDCSADTSICNNINLQAFVNENCQRTASALHLSTLQHRELNTALGPAVCAQENNHFQFD
ncbi:hypothetical protein WR25_21899 [Diploscapter pachys]|uniref:ShKT domain-containing protein n=1 Tax=Diploscapter pachys TaxID=2018661 RepID=A0A2A2LZA3_9BILA|nr:hypothetical protein WR25_21899 [Diploscapter pachys]